MIGICSGHGTRCSTASTSARTATWRVGWPAYVSDWRPPAREPTAAAELKSEAEAGPAGLVAPRLVRLVVNVPLGLGQIAGRLMPDAPRPPAAPPGECDQPGENDYDGDENDPDHETGSLPQRIGLNGDQEQHSPAWAAATQARRRPHA